MATLTDAQRAAGWKIVKLEDIAPIKYGKSLPAKKRIPGNVKVYSSAGVIGTHNKAIIDGKNIIIGRKGNIGSISWSDGPAYPIDTVFYTAGTELVDIRFLYYLLSSYDFTGYNTDSAVPGLNRQNFESTEVAIPPIEEQERIASILGSLDDKIEANNRIIQTMSDICYESHNIVLAFKKNISVKDIVDIIRVNVPVESIDQESPYIALDNLPRRNIFSHSWEGSSQIMSNKSSFQKGDILFGKLRPYFHKVSVAAIDGICSTDILVFRPKPGLEGLAYGILGSDDIIEYATQMSSGTRMPRVSWKDIMDYKTTITYENIENLNLKMTNFHHMSSSLIRENIILAESHNNIIKKLIG